MSEKILSRMKRGVYYPGHHLGPREELDVLVESGLLERMHPSYLCGPENEPVYCLSGKERKRAVKGKTSQKAMP
jgi:hypothetical protein